MLPGPKLNLDLSARTKLADKLRRGKTHFSFEEDPAFSALCTCIGLQFEVGNAQLDRLSPFFGMEVSETSVNPWNAQIFTNQDEIGICFTPKNNSALIVKHPDLRYIIAADSFNGKGELNRIIIYPNRVAESYSNLGFELVIVRDWLLATALSSNPERYVSYLYVNPWEIKTNIARMQVALMSRRQLAFFGTHDIVDHLLDADRILFENNLEQFIHTEKLLNKIFENENSPSLAQLSLSYLVGVLLDDLAQPAWYRSHSHRDLIQLAMNELEKQVPGVVPREIILPTSFHELMKTVRTHTTQTDILVKQFNRFCTSLEIQKEKGTSVDVPNQFDRFPTAEVGFSLR